MSDKKSKAAGTPAPAQEPAAKRHVKDIPLEERLPAEFKPLYLWWKSNGNYFTVALCVVVAAFALYKYNQRSQERKRTEVGRAILNTAGDASQRANALEGITSQHGSSSAGKNAYILLGKAYFDAERYEDALNAYRHFLSKNSAGAEFAHIAMMGEAQSLEALNRPDEAKASYELFIAKHGEEHYLRPEAEMGRARCIMLKGDKPAALAALEVTNARYGQTDWAPRIEQMKGVIERHVPRAPRKRLSLSDRLSMGGLGDDAEPIATPAADGSFIINPQTAPVENNGPAEEPAPAEAVEEDAPGEATTPDEE